MRRLPYPKGLASSLDFSPYGSLNTQVVESIARQQLNCSLFGGGKTQVRQAYSLTVPYVSRCYNCFDPCLAAAYLDLYARAFGVGQISEMMLLFGANIFARAQCTFIREPFVLLSFVNFITTYLPGLSFMGVDLLKLACHNRCSVEEQFRALKQANDLRTSLGIRTHAHSIRSNRARATHGKILQLMNRFWVKLTEPSVNIKEVAELADNIRLHRRTAIEQYDAALSQLQSVDPAFLRRLGDFFSQVLMSTDAAQECYTEARDIYEMRQARSMRGTRQHTVEVDVASVTERMRQLLHFHSAGGGVLSSKASASSIVQLFSVILLAIFACLAIFCTLQIFLVSTMDNSLKEALLNIYSINSLWTSTLRLGASVVMVESTFSSSALDTSLKAEIGSLLSEFLSSLKFIVGSTKGYAANRKMTPFLTMFTIPMYSIASENTYGYSLWGLSEDFLQAVDRYINETNPTSGVTASEFNTIFIFESSDVLAKGFEKYLNLEVNTRLSSATSIWILFLILIFICNVILLLLAYGSLMLVFERTALGRVFTFQLFTLIPYDSLEKLATEARERYHQIHLEKSFRSNNIHTSTSANAVETPRVETATVDVVQKADTIEVVKIAALPYVKSKDVQLKPCIKKNAEVSSSGVSKSKVGAKKQVSFNPMVEVVGGGSEPKKEGNAKGSTDGGSVFPVAIPKAKHKKRMESAKLSQKSSSFSVKWLGSFFFVMLISLICIMILVGFSFFDLRRYQRDVNELMNFQKILNKCALIIPRGVESTLRFMFTGSTTAFQSAQDDIIGAVNEIPNLMGTNIPSDSVPQLVKMHKTAKTILNTSLDASSLASYSLGVSLAHWGNTYDRTKLTEAELSAQLQLQYPKAYETAKKIYAVAESSFELNSIFSFVIFADNVINQVSDFLTLCNSVYSDLLEEQYDSSPGSITLVAVAVAFGCIPGVFSLLLAVTPLHRYAQKYISRTFAFMVFLSFAAVITICAYIAAKGHSIDLAFRTYSNATLILSQLSSDVLSQVLLLQSFVISANPLRWFQWSEVKTKQDSQVLSDFLIENFLEKKVADLFYACGELIWDLRTLGNVSSALAINALDSAMVVEPPMADALTYASWDYSAQPDYGVNRIRYPETIFYTDKTTDLTKTLDEQLEISWATAMGSESYSKFLLLVTKAMSIEDVFIEEQGKSLKNSKTLHGNLLSAALGLCGLPFIALIITAFRLRNATSESHDSNTSSRSTSIEYFKYRAMLQRAFVMFSILIIFYVATFGVGLWFNQTVFAFSSQMVLSARKEADVASSLLGMWKAIASELTFSSVASITPLNRRIYTALTEQFGSTSYDGVPIGLRASDVLDEYMFGSADSSYMNELLSSFFYTQCGENIIGNGPLGYQVNYVPVSGLTTTISGALTDWVAYMARAVAEAESPDSTLFDIGSALSPNSELSTPILGATRNATTVLLGAFASYQETYGDILLGLAVVSLLMTLFCFVVVGIPTIYRLFDEQYAVRILLQIIPTSIRDEVPAIQQHVETGKISDYSELHHKFEQNEKLLQNILPQKIANRLKSGEQPIADTHECVTILFTDFVGFTKRSSTMQAGEIVAFLNEVFLEFDTVVELLALEKIKTIGDAFFMAGGLDPHVSDHALRVVEAGLMFFEALDEHNKRHPGRVPLQMRLGVHSGPVVAGVIGIKKVAYDLWGDSVEIANAMESTGVPGFVHISETTAVFVQGIFRLAPRGELPREKEHIPEDMPKTYLVVERVLPTPYMHLRRPRLMPTNLGADEKP